MSPQPFRRRLFVAAAVLAALANISGRAAAPIAAVQRGRRGQVPAEGRASAGSDYPSSIRRPRGIYAVVVLEDVRGAAEFDALVQNPAVSGLAIRVFWSMLQPEKGRSDFSRLDAAFASAEAAHKTVQLILVPGFGTPKWVLDELTSCDDQLSASTTGAGGTGDARGGRAGNARGGRAGTRGGRGTARSGSGSVSSGGSEETASCGKATFDVSEGRAQGQAQELPLPWNPVYKNYWKAFLTEVAARYGTRAAFVSIAVSGPTAESVEIILPRAGDQLERWGQLLELSYRDPSYHRSDKAFVDEWSTAVTMFGQVFRAVTIVLTRGSGLLDFTRGQGPAAQASIVTTFAGHDVGAIAKATQTSGLKACRESKGGIEGVKEMASSGSYSPSILGGAQFDTSFSQKPGTEGCSVSCDAESASCQSVTPAQALSNVLSVYFDGTPDGAAFGASKGSARMNYLQIYARDILFANAQPAVQSILEHASQRLLAQAR